jgi:hypothetical protein
MLPEVIVLYFLKDCGYTEYNKPVLISGEVVKILVLSSQHKTSQNCSAFFCTPFVASPNLESARALLPLLFCEVLSVFQFASV